MVKPEMKVTLMEQQGVVLIELLFLVGIVDQVDLQYLKILVSPSEVTIKESLVKYETKEILMELKVEMPTVQQF